MCPGVALTGRVAWTKTRTCSSIGSFDPSELGAHMHQDFSPEVTAVLDGVRDLLPTFRERAEEGDRLRVIPDASIKELEETGFFRLLQPKRYGGLEADPVAFYTARARHRLGRTARPAGSPASSASTRGRSRSSTTRPSRPCGVPTRRVRLSSSLRADGQGGDHRGRLHALRQVELLLRQRPLLVGAARRPRLQRGGPGRRLPHRSWSRASKYQVVDVWNVVGLRGTGSNDIVVEETSSSPRSSRSRWARPASCKGPGPGGQHQRPLQAAVPLDLHHAPSRRRSSAWRRARTPSTSRCSRSGSVRRTSARRRPWTRSPRSASPAPRRRSTPPGRC